MTRAVPTPAARASCRRATLADPFYYLTNFSAVLRSLQERYGALLSAQESQFMAQFAALPRASAALLVRMLMRRGALFRSSRLVYPEIGELAAAAAPLLELGWIDEPLLDVNELQQLLTKAELTRCFPSRARLLRSIAKSALGEVLSSQYPGSRRLHGWFPECPDGVYRSVLKGLGVRFRLMFFGNFHQDWSEFVLADLGLSSYEKVPRSMHSAAFRTRAHLDAFEQMYRCRQWLEEGVAFERILAALPAPLADADWLEEIRHRLLFQIATGYERSGQDSSALALLAECTYRGARLRAARLYERLRRWDAARDLCLLARRDPRDASERQQVDRLLRRLNRKLGVCEPELAERCPVPSFELVAEPSRPERAVEYYVRDRLAREEGARSSVHYVENALVNSLFGLLCWKALFAPVPGAFFHDFQAAPADLESTRFYGRRRVEFDECLAELDSDRYQDTIRRRFFDKAGIRTPFVAWGLLNRALLERALQCFPASHLRLWFDWIARDVRGNRTGFPDLVQFWPRERRYRLVEVKGPGDRLQDNQRRFLEYCISHDMPITVCRVRVSSRGEIRDAADIA